MADLLGVSVAELVTILKRKKARIPFEIGAFVALEACEAVIQGPARIGIRDVRISDDGTVSVFAPPNSASNDDAAKSVVQVLAHLLVAAGPGVPPVLLDLVERGPSDGRWDISRLRDELEASLVPLNRQAARRVLSRMLREAARDGDLRKSSLPPPPEENDVDAALDGLLGGGSSALSAPRVPTAAPVSAPVPQVIEAPAGGRRPEGRGRFDDSSAVTLDRGLPMGAVIRADETAEEDYEFEEQATLVKDASLPPPPMDRPTQPMPDDLLDELSAEVASLAPPGGPFPAPARAPALEPVKPVAEAPWEPPSRRQDSVDLSGLEEVAYAKKKGRGIWWALLFLLLSAGLLAGVAVLRPDAVDRFRGNETPEEREQDRLIDERNAEQLRIVEEHAARYGVLTVDATPAEAQVFRYVGRGPAIAAELPVGVAHEFLVIPEGKAPTRAVVPADAIYEATDDGPLYELPVQGSVDDMAFEDLVLGDTQLPRDALGSPSGETGRVRVVTAPREAKVYQLIGFAPSVRIENQRTDQPVELLVWAEGHQAQRVLLGPSDWTDEAGERGADISVELVPVGGALEEE
ncbi:MAG: hypothetical protein DRJ42_09360 [Deltaproteobacteria bacterium]|nr:MAG: hypothetical protein DRJ42_09360 [Deltaproteobacteria bacterium]